MIGELRIVAILKRIAKALEESNRIARTRLDREIPSKGGPVQHFEISKPTVEKWNENYQKRRAH